MFLKRLAYNFAKKQIQIVDAEKLMFDETNKCLIFRQFNGEVINQNNLEFIIMGIERIKFFYSIKLHFSFIRIRTTRLLRV